MEESMSAENDNGSWLGHRTWPMRPSSQEMDYLRAHEMNSLSRSEREDVLNDIHGVPHLTLELEEYLIDKFAALDAAIAAELSRGRDESPNSHHAFSQAMSADQSYVKDEGLRLAFLRAEVFDCDRAAKRFLSFFQQKLELFGHRLLCRDIALSDLEQSDLQILESGQIQLLSKRDQAGRRIMCMLRMYENFEHPNNLLRAVYYMIMAAVEDEETQRKGLVGIVYKHPSTWTLSAQCYVDAKKTQASAMKLCDILPARYVAMHYCVKDEAMERLAYGEIGILGSRTRVRSRVHKVSPMESNYLLASFGIALQTLPLTILGTIKTEDHRRWLHQREVAESSEDITCAQDPIVKSSTMVLAAECLAPYQIPSADLGDASNAQCCSDDHREASHVRGHSVSPGPPRTRISTAPRKYDVLFGRGKVKSHPGNLLLHRLIGEYKDRYEAAAKWEKTLIATEIISIIREHSGRFLKPEQLGGRRAWTIVDVATAREKVSHTFRSERSKSSSIFSKHNNC